MNQVGVWVLGAISIAVLLGCSSSSSDKSAGPTCNTPTDPKFFTVVAATPAAGASVPNSAIVQKFSIMEPVRLENYVDGYGPGHTAGTPTPALQWTDSPNSMGGVDYTSNAVSWATAPGKVEYDFQGVYLEASSGCYYAFQNPVLSYDITAP